MRVGLVGAHRVGKTTTAEHLQEAIGKPFIRTDVTGTFEKAGKDPRVVEPFSNRLDVQELILEACIEQWKGETDFITDRTPLDFLMYTYCDIVGKTEVDHDRLLAYREACLKACYDHFDRLFVIQPAVPIVEVTGKALCNKSYIDELNYMAIGLLFELHHTIGAYVVPKPLLSIEERISFIRERVLY